MSGGRQVRILAIACGLLACTPSPTRADWLITPWLGQKVAGQTTFIDLDQGVGTAKLTYGASVGLLGSGLLGVEADLGFTPRFFERGRADILVPGSSVTTLMGNLILAAPRGWVGESLRPYLVGGLGLIHVNIDGDVFGVESNLLGMTTGGGAIGPLSARTSIRFDVRYLRNVTADERPAIAFGRTRLSFWRLTAGVTIEY